MANDLYSRDANFETGEYADGPLVESEFDAVETGFDQTEARLNGLDTLRDDVIDAASDATNSAASAATSATSASQSAAAAFQDAVTAENAQSAAVASLYELLEQGGLLNRLMNTDFRYWRRGPTSLVGPGYGPDAWETTQSTNDTITMSRQSMPPDNLALGVQVPYYLRCTVVPDGSPVPGSNVIQQNIESVYTLAGEQVFIAAWLRSSISFAGQLVNFVILQHFGTGGSPTAPRIAAYYQHVLTTDWQRATFSPVLPNLAGTVIGSNRDSRVVLKLQFPTNLSGHVDVNLCVFRKGSAAAEWAQYDPGAELGRLNRRLIISELDNQEAELAHSMLQTPTKSGAGPFVYDAEY